MRRRAPSGARTSSSTCLFKGTRTRTALDIAIAFDAVGGDHNAVTSKEYTCYYGKVRDRDLPMAISVLADMVTSALIDPDEFETERGVIIEELAAATTIRATSRASASSRRCSAGTRSAGRRRDDPDHRGDAALAVLDHYRAHYRPQELVVAAAGAVDHDALVEALLAGLAAGGWDLGASAQPVPRRTAVRPTIEQNAAPILVKRPLEQVSVVFGGDGLNASALERPTLGVLVAVLGGGMSSRLWQEVRERRGLVYGISAFAPTYSDAGYFAIGASCTPGKVKDVLEVSVAEWARMAAEPITEVDLARAVGQLSGSAALALEDSDVR